MKAPTSPQYPVGWPVGFSSMVALLFLGCTVVLGDYIWTTITNPVGQWWRVLVLLLAWLVSMQLLWCHYRRRVNGLLRYDGEHWWFELAQSNGHVFAEQVVLLECVWALPQHTWLCLKWNFVPDEKPLAVLYVWASMGKDVSQWLTFRRALMFHKSHPKQPVSASMY